MNLPNKLTMFRVILIPFFIFFILTDICGSASPWIALAIFCVASLTDLLDGKIARKYNLVTNFGKFMDPLADKLLVCSALICMIGIGVLPAWFVIIIIAREFIISGFRLIASDSGVVIAASMWGKVKTVFQMCTLIFLMAMLGFGFGLNWSGASLKMLNPDGLDAALGFVVAGNALCWISLALTVVSLIDYLVKNKDVMKDQK